MTDIIDPERRDFLTGKLLPSADKPAAEHHISSFLVHALPALADQVAAALAELEGIEIHAKDPSGKLILTLESDDDSVIAQRLADIHNIRGVLSAALVFHHFEPTNTRG